MGSKVHRVWGLGWHAPPVILTVLNEITIEGTIIPIQDCSHKGERPIGFPQPRTLNLQVHGKRQKKPDLRPAGGSPCGS